MVTEYRTGGAQLLIPGVTVIQPRADAPGGQSALYQSLVAFWKLDEASGNRADSIGANTLTDNNTVGSAAGLAYALAGNFVAASSESLSVADNAALSMGDVDFWIGTWVYHATISTQYYVAKRNVASNFEYQVVLVNPDDKVSFYVSHDGGTGALASIQNAQALSAATWYFVLAWHDSVANTINLQVNNNTVASVAHTTGVFNGASDLFLGAENIASGFLNGRQGPTICGKGYVPDADERTWLYNAGAGRTLADLLAYAG